MNKPWKVLSASVLASSLLLAGCVNEKDEATKTDGNQSEEAKKGASKVNVSDYTFDTAGNMFAYAEFELSGEPLAESLGLDLDILDINKIDEPTQFDYTAGVESYEYSEEAMYEVVEKSGMGLHLINGPVVDTLQNGKTADEKLGNRFYELADAVGYPQDEIFRNMYPTFIEYSAGDPHYKGKVDTSEYAANDDGSYVPMYQVNFESLRWDRDKMEKTLVPSAYGATFLKQALWAGDFMGGFHTIDGDEELSGETSKDDEDKNVALGVSSADGFQGAVLTEEIWNKVNYIGSELFVDASTGDLAAAGLGSQYDPSEGYVYLPHSIEVTEDGMEAPSAKSLSIKDSNSVLEDQWMMLWPSSEFYGMTDQRESNPNKTPSFQALFDDAPYPSAPKENTDDSPDNDVNGTDPFTANQNVMLHIFKNIDAMHFNDDKGMFVTENDGKEQGTYMDTFQAGYTMESIRIFQRAIDGLPVGYASGESAEGLKTPEGKRALEMIRKQADFMIDDLVMDSGLVAKGFDADKGADKEVTLDAQLGAIRGLTAAYLATDDEKYREAARSIYEAMDSQLWDDDLKAYETSKGKMDYTPYTAGALSATYRVALQNLSNRESDSETPESLEIDAITARYSDFYDTVIDGPSLEEGMQASEFWDTGDYYDSKDSSGNTDGDNVPQIQAGHGKNGIAPVLLPVTVEKR
ncbi:hypothetical protein [Rossellomorea vietnamensis]|uniref:Uncharacterized protein n=1 Tax=Rossellomorea vietnamensis TaxID=218284 RepID=A0A0P6VV85_9BACI|nr:hypothetical protein [Rossellomorea vietnamensis]KPL58678.1 hypothetical protein AM506_15190 [Rossellomorea vietnamensis]